MTLRCTRKLLARLRAPAPLVAARPTTVLGDWYAGFYEARPQPIVLCLNERSLLAVLLTYGNAESLTRRFRHAVLDLLTRIEVPRDLINAERNAMSDAVIGPTVNRRVLGCLNEAAFAVAGEFDWMHERWFGDHEMCLSRFNYSTTQYRLPHELAKELFQAAQPGLRRGHALGH